MLNLACCSQELPKEHGVDNVAFLSDMLTIFTHGVIDAFTVRDQTELRGTSCCHPSSSTDDMTTLDFRKL